MNMVKTSGQEQAPVQYCDRCARRSSTLVLDDLSLQELCAECRRELARLRARHIQPIKAGR
ncbi:MAG: hypothetical protein AB1555_09285 [Nitrospirota bacterium]